jgi:hypothetical protein
MMDESKRKSKIGFKMLQNIETKQKKVRRRKL